MWGRRNRKQRSRTQAHPYDSVTECIKKHSSCLIRDKTETVSHLKQTLENLREQQRALPFTGRHLRDRKRLRWEIAEAETELNRIETDQHIEEFVELAAPLLEPIDDYTIKQQQHALFVNLFYGSRSAPSFIDQTHCHQCGAASVLSSSESKDVCVGCGSVRSVLFCPTDYMDEERTKATEYERVPLYKKYLSQFHEDTTDPPVEILAVISEEFSKVHMMVKLKVKPTPVAQILRTHGLHKWSQMSQRICRYLNAEKIAVMSDQLIERLVARFEKVTNAFLGTIQESRKKIMNFEYLTRQFLFMEGRPDLADCFSLHKTREVLRKADQTMALCCATIGKIFPSDNWTMSRSC